MSDLIERLRGACSLPTGLYGETADELERLQRENEELRNAIDQEMVTTHLGVFNRGDDPVKAIKELMLWSQGVGEYFAKEELATLKAQSTEQPVAWMFQHEETGRTMCIETQQVEWGFEQNNPRLQKIFPLYTTPPTATALVEDFKRRVKEAIRNERLVDDTGTEGDEAYNTALDHAENAIESLPLIGEE